MGATEEQMALVADVGIDHVAYVLILYSFAFLLYLFTNVLIHIYCVNIESPAVPPKDGEDLGRRALNGHVRGTDSRQVRDAEEFELEGLMSDDEGHPESPSTLGKNEVPRVE